jgi:hypothetical protein
MPVKGRERESGCLKGRERECACLGGREREAHVRKVKKGRARET